MLWDSLSTQDRSRFGAMFYRWKAIGQIKPRLAVALTRRKMPAKVVLHFVYRTGEYALLDWSAELRHVLSQHASASEAIPQLNFGMQLKSEFLRSLLFRRQVFSLPSIGYAEAAAALDGKLIAAADEALHTAADSIQFMQVVEADLRQRKMPQTATARSCRGMWLPVMLQVYLPLSFDGEAAGTVTLRADGAPVLRDLLDLAPWQVWRGGVRLWQHMAGIEPGTLCASTPEMVCLREWDMREPCTPAIVMLDKLVHDGWRVGRAPLEHTLDTPRVFPRPSQMSQRYYWRCLATFDKLCANGLQVLPRGKPQPYYMNVLAEYLGDVPALVDVTHGTVARSLLRSDSQSSADVAPQDFSYADVPMASLGGKRPILSKHASGTKAKRIRPADQSIAEALGTNALWHALPAALDTPESLVLAATAMEPIPISVLADAPSAESAVLLLLAPEVASGFGSIVDMVEGQAVRVEERGIEGTLGYYRRICVTCPFHTLPRALPCRARRNTGPRQTARLGVHEPLAYIGAWLERGSSFSSREDHVAFKPSDAETRAYALRVRLCSEDTLLM